MIAQRKALFLFLEPTAESDAGENLWLGRRLLGYTGDKKEFRFTELFAKRLPGEKYNRMLELIDEYELTRTDITWLRNEARKLYNSEISHLRSKGIV